MTKEDVIKLRKEKMSKSNLETVRQNVLGVSYKIEKEVIVFHLKFNLILKFKGSLLKKDLKSPFYLHFL